MNFSNTVTAAMATALNTTIGASSKAELFTGSNPASPDIAATGTLVATLIIPSFSVSGATLTATGVPLTATAVAGGTVGYMRVYESNGTTPIQDLVYGTDFAMANASVNANTTVSVTSLTTTISQ